MKDSKQGDPKALTPPEWFSRGSIYQINPRTFSEEGTIRAVTRELPFLASAGFDIMYLCPVFEEDISTDESNWSKRQKASETGNPKNPYRMNNYFKIDEEYGSEDDLRDFIATAHSLNMKVLLDLVYLHIGPNASVLKRHPNFAMHDENGDIILSEWQFPRLNFSDAGLCEYLWCNMVYYIGEMGADGFRCDVGDAVPLDFWKEGRRRIQCIKPDAVLLNEGSDWSYLEEAFDCSYNFAWHNVLYKIAKGELEASALKEDHARIKENAPSGAVFMRDIDTHDTVTDRSVRLEIAVGHTGMELIEVLNYIIDGVPMVYCGNELGDTANLNMFANRFFKGKFEFTDRTKKSEAYSLRRQAVLKQLNELKHKSDILLHGETVWLDNSCKSSVVSFSRSFGGKSIAVIANFSGGTVSCSVDNVPACAVHIMESEKPVIEDDGIYTLAPYGYAVIEY